MAGLAICKRVGSNFFEKRIGQHRFEPGSRRQSTATLKPGQMMFVVTHEEVNMPMDLCGTVYSRNSLALDGILALNAGHVDPGYQGPITIKLINLSSVDYTLTLGEPIYTIVFTRVDQPEDPLMTKNIYSHERMEKRVIKATNIGLSNALYDLALLRDFVKKDEFGKSLGRWLFKTLWGWVAFIISILAATASVLKIIDYIK